MTREHFMRMGKELEDRKEQIRRAQQQHKEGRKAREGTGKPTELEAE